MGCGHQSGLGTIGEDRDMAHVSEGTVLVLDEKLVSRRNSLHRAALRDDFVGLAI
jgi:hypothetical protein